MFEFPTSNFRTTFQKLRRKNLLCSFDEQFVTFQIDLMKTKEAYHVASHIQAKNLCENGLREFDTELPKLVRILPEHALHYFKLARKMWADSVVKCNTNIETLKVSCF